MVSLVYGGQACQGYNALILATVSCGRWPQGLRLLQLAQRRDVTPEALRFDARK